MNICIIYVLYGGFTMGTPACQTQLLYGNGVITPHEVVYTSHIPEYWLDRVYHVPRYRVNYRGLDIRVKRYRHIRKRYNRHARYHKHKKHYKRRHKHYRRKHRH